MKHTRTRTTAFALLLIAGSGLAAAGPEKEKSRDNTLLRGPKVVNHDQPTRHDRKDSMRDQRDHRDPMKISDKEQNRPISVAEILGALRQLQSPSAEGALNLTKDQRNQITKINIELRTAMRKFQEEHKDEFQAMRQRVRPGTPPPPNRADKKPHRDHKPIESANPDHQQKEKRALRAQDAKNAPNRSDRKHAKRPAQDKRAMQMREKLRTMIANSPPNREAIAKLRNVLTPEQLKLIRAHIHKARATRGPNGQRPDQVRRQRTDRRDGADRQRRVNDNPNTDHPNARRHMNKDRINKTDKKDAQRGKPSKKGPSQGSATDDNGIFSEAPDIDGC